MNVFYEWKDQKFELHQTNVLNFPPHFHLFPELLYLKKGQLCVLLDGEELHLHSGDLMIVFPNRIHSYQTESPTAETDIMFSIFNYTALPLYHKAFDTMHPQAPSIPCAQVHPDILYAVAALERELLPVQNEQAVLALIQLILARAVPLLSLTENAAGCDSEIMKDIMEYLSGHYDQPLSLGDLERQFGVSRYQISRMFSRVLKTRFDEYLNMLRIYAAQRLLESSDESIIHIAYQSGFQSQQTFNRAFKNEFGVTPREYRKNGAVSLLSSGETAPKILLSLPR